MNKNELNSNVRGNKLELDNSIWCIKHYTTVQIAFLIVTYEII